MTRSDAFVLTLMIVTFLIWANSFIAIAVLRQSVSALELVTLRFVPVGIVSLAIAFGLYRRESLRLLREHFGRILACGMLNVLGYNFLLNTGMSWVTPGASSLLISLTPLFTLSMAFRYLGERFSLRRLGSTLVTFGGLAIVVLLGKVSYASTGSLITADKLPYAFCIMGASLCWSVSTVLSKPLMQRHSPVAYNYVVLSVGCAPFFFALNGDLLGRWWRFSAGQHFSLAFLALACTVLAFALWFVALKHWKASNVTLFVYLNPPLTAIFDFLFNGRGITGYFALGGAVMLGGLLLATWTPARSAKTQ